tara:strand:- start:4120 stop:5247 length:1128 start_codon:yes stop_codon:yes gene_type:complete
MKKLIFEKFFEEVLLYFLFILGTLSIIVWIIQSVNYLDLVTEDGHSLKVYAYYSLLNLPKIISRILLFVLFLSICLVIINYERRNEIIIFWINGISKLQFVNQIIKFSIFFLIIQFFFALFLVPFTQDKAKSFIRSSDIGYLKNIIKEKSFFDGVKNLTIFVNKKEDNRIYDVFIKDNKANDTTQTIYASEGLIEHKDGSTYLLLKNGKFINNDGGYISSFSFDKTKISLSIYETKTTIYRKFQETNTFSLLYCFKESLPILNEFLKKYKSPFLRCDVKREDILIELFKRSYLPIYIPLLVLIGCCLVLISKDEFNYKFKRLGIFLYGFIVISLSEVLIRYSTKDLLNTFIFLSLPISVFIFNYFFIYYKFEFKK